MLLASALAGLLALAAPAAVLLRGAGNGLSDEALKALSDRCGSQIPWLRDGTPPEDLAPGGAFRGLKRSEEPDRKALLDEALARAKAEKRMVLWHVYRFQGGHMYRAPVLDDYMDQVLWSDPELVALVSSSFVPLRTQCPKELGKDYGLVAWDYVEPALAFLSPEGKVLHVIDRIRTFDPRWFALVLQRVLAAHPELAPAGAADASANSARSVFTTLDATTLESTRRSYYEGLSSYFAGKEAAALTQWSELAAASPESPYAWRAAANLAPAPDKTFFGAARHCFEHPFATHLPADGSIPYDTRWRRTPADADAVGEAGLRWLLRAQRPDGSWNDCRYAYWPDPSITPNAWMAITALAATALSEWRDFAPKEVDDALARAEDYLFSSGRVNPGRNEENYAHAYRILYLERAIKQASDEGQREELKKKMKVFVDQVTRIQTDQGQWAHEYPNAFATAVVLDALKRAQDLDVGVPEIAIEKGVAGLLSARYEDGSFDYGGTHGTQQNQAPGADHLKDSSGRMPVCEAALFVNGKSDVRNLAKALVVYQQHYDRFEKIHKCDFHTDGELGGFFFFHDLYHATEAVLRLPAAGQKSFKKWFVEKLTSLPEIDGSFLDDHEIGKSCSTALALLSLKNMLDE